MPRVSICLPNLNMRPFLAERLETIFTQTYADWELFVYDSLSDDGAWELFQHAALKEPKMRAIQGPRAGPYPAWNECLKQTKGEFIYIATSDDTMAPDCLEKLVDALDRNPTCDLAHCPLRVIDATGSPSILKKWPDLTVFADGLGEFIKTPHIRKAPHDGLLHLMGRHVYLSITQLLIRRSLFQKIGNFPSTWGSFSDFNWEMKASLVASTVHVPDTWASWRIHPAQSTVFSKTSPLERSIMLEEMIADAITSSRPWIYKETFACPLIEKSKNLRTYHNFLNYERSFSMRRLYQLRQLLSGPVEIRSEIMHTFQKKRMWPEGFSDDVRSWINQIQGEPAISIDNPIKRKL